jgi:FAD/FMN-containing dehydrogenase
MESAMTPSAADWDALERAIDGDVVLPGSPDYDSLRKPAIPRFHDVPPQAVVLCRSPADVAETIRLARRTGLPTATRSGGHCFAGHSSTDGIVVDVTPIRSVSGSCEVATVGAGARLGAVYDALAEHDLTIPAGCGPTVGIAGLTLGGGLGILGRTHGLTADHLLAAQVVLADGRVVDCDQQRDPELFWALRGAGGGFFGVVTSLAFRTVPAPEATSFHLVWPPTDAAAVLDAWQALAPDGPDELAASLLVTASGDLQRPPVVNVFGAMLGTEADTAVLLEELVARVGADPTSAVRKHQSYRATKRYLAEHGPGEERPLGHPFSKSEFFARPLPADATAFVHRQARFLLKHAVVVDPDTASAEREAARRWLARSWASVHPWGSGGVYQNFPDPDLDDPPRAYYGGNLGRLRRAKARYDPDGFF